MGQGIPRKDLRNVFKMFWRGHTQSSRPRGSGLGLYIVRNIVRAHGGSVWASSTGLGRGSTFSIKLPRLRKYWGMAARKSPRPQTESRI